MEFWGVEVKAGEPVEINPDDLGKCIHLSQAALGEGKKDKASEHVALYINIGDQKLVLGNLSHEKFPQLSFDLVLEKKFELSHNWKNGSVYFFGYKAKLAVELNDFTDSEDDEDLPLMAKDNAKPDIKPEVAKAATSKSNDVKFGESKKQVKVVGPKKDEDVESEDEEDDESDDEDDENGSSDEDLMDGDGDGDSDEDEDETPPKKADQAKKRPNDSVSKTPVPAKKAKSAIPQMADGKKGGHIGTPYPLKQGGKTTKSEAKDKDKTPKSGGQFSCKSCSKSFTSEGGLQQHSKAKHGGP